MHIMDGMMKSYSSNEKKIKNTHHSEDNGWQGSIKHVKPIDLQQQISILIRCYWNENNVLHPSFWTYIFERQHDGCDDARHKYYNPQDTEKAPTLGKVHLWTETLIYIWLDRCKDKRTPNTHTFVWKQNTVTVMQTTAVIPRARNTAFVS